MATDMRWEMLIERAQRRTLAGLVDGLLVREVHDAGLSRHAGCVPLLDGTPDASLAEAGAWMLDAAIQPTACRQLAQREADRPHLCWLISDLPADRLLASLRDRLNVALPAGGTALLRLQDPRALIALAATLAPAQRTELFRPAREWHFMYDGRPWWIEGADA